MAHCVWDLMWKILFGIWNNVHFVRCKSACVFESETLWTISSQIPYVTLKLVVPAIHVDMCVVVIINEEIAKNILHSKLLYSVRSRRCFWTKRLYKDFVILCACYGFTCCSCACVYDQCVYVQCVDNVFPHTSVHDNLLSPLWMWGCLFNPQSSMTMEIINIHCRHTLYCFILTMVAKLFLNQNYWSKIIFTLYGFRRFWYASVYEGGMLVGMFCTYYTLLKLVISPFLMWKF